MRPAAWTVAFLCCCAVAPALACAGAVSVDVSFDRGSSMLTAPERSKLESAVGKARAASGRGSLKVAFAIYSQEGEVDSKIEVNRLTEQRVRALRESFAMLGLEASAVLAVLGDSKTQQVTSPGTGGFAEVEIAFACGGS